MRPNAPESRSQKSTETLKGTTQQKKYQASHHYVILHSSVIEGRQLTASIKHLESCFQCCLLFTTLFTGLCTPSLEADRAKQNERPAWSLNSLKHAFGFQLANSLNENYRFCCEQCVERCKMLNCQVRKISQQQNIEPRNILQPMYERV